MASLENRADRNGNGTAPAHVTAVYIADRILDAIAAGRLPAGAKLGEIQIASFFHVGRTIVRDALKHLKAMGVVDLFPNRGAFVAQPTSKDAEDAYAARRLIENALVVEAARNCSSADIRALRQHVALERAAEKAGNRRDLIHLLGEFHLLVGKMGGNTVLLEILEGLIPRTAILLVLYEDPGHACAVDEHADLVDLIAKGDEKGCVKLMSRHLATNKGALNFVPAEEQNVDLAQALEIPA
jgi:DNA-binding GntR family transcriptional regulator